MLQLTDGQVEAALYAVTDLVARRRLEGSPVPAEVVSLHRTLTAASVCGTENDSPASELDDDPIVDSTEAAELLGCSTRWVRCIRADLDGRKVGGRWVFQRQDIVNYARARESVT